MQLTLEACEGTTIELARYKKMHWTKEDGSTSLVRGLGLQTFPSAPQNTEDRQPKLKVSVMALRVGSCQQTQK